MAQNLELVTKEYLKCRLSMLYFIENYIKIPVAGGLVTMKESDLWNNTRKYKDFVRLSESKIIDNIEILFSRQHGKTTTIAMVILYYMIFYPRLPVQFLTLSKDNAFDVIDRIKFMMTNLPKWLQVPMMDRGGKKTYIELENKSKITTRYVSGNINPDQIGRGFSSPMIWVDEAAFVPHMEIVWGSMQPALSAARVFAKKNNFPTKVFLSTTPNGAGTNWFYQMWKNGWDYEDIYDFEKNEPYPDAPQILNSSDHKNNFVKVKIHWSETGKTEEWYKQQVKELNFDMRRINQEINLVFLGSANSVFSDEVIAALEPKPVVAKIEMAYSEYFDLFEPLDPKKTYLLGVDNAASTASKADFSALVLTEAETGKQVGEWHGKFSVLKRFAVVVKSLIQRLGTLHGLTPDNLKVIIERNSFGLGVIEEIIYDDTFDYENFIYYGEIRGEKVPGLNTNKSNREQMFNFLLSHVNEHPEYIQGKLLQEELRTLEQKPNGRFEASKGSHDDVIMAYNFTLLIRHEMILNGEITTEDTPSALKMDPKEINNFIDVTFSTAYQKELNKFKEQNEKIIIKEDPNEIKRIKREILKDYQIADPHHKIILDDSEEFEDYIIM